MPKSARKKHTHTSRKIFTSPFNIYWEKNNYYFLFAGIAVIILGFYIMSVGAWNSTTSLVVSPILLVIGYTLILPASIFYRKKNNVGETKGDEVAAGKS